MTASSSAAIPSKKSAKPGKLESTSASSRLTHETGSSSSSEEIVVHPENIQDGADSDASGSDDEADLSKLVHETVSGENKNKNRASKKKFVPSEETPEQREERTIFVGNVPVDIVKSKVWPLL